MKIQRLFASELPQFLKMQHKTFSANGDTEGPAKETITQLHQDFQIIEFYKIIEDGRMIGGCAIEQKDDHTYHIHRFFIDRDYQNKQYGQQAMELLMKIYDWQTIRLQTPKHQTRNLHFYDKLGFHPIGIERVSEHYVLVTLEKRRNLL